MEYTVKIEKNGEFCPVGYLSENGFIYDCNFLSNPEAKPISVSLPLRNEKYDLRTAKIFFEGLLPEGFSRKSVADWMHVSEDDFLSILAGLGRECLGAIMISSGKETENAGYRELSINEVRALAAEGATRSAKLVTESHLSLTGASGKVGLYHNENNGKWYLPSGTAPSTHIVKQSHVRLKNIVVNELLCLRTAKKCGIEVPECFIIDTGGKEDKDILFAVKRYDRIMTEKNRYINGMPVPFRLHQEDFAQAMGIASSCKYEPENGNYIAGMFEILRQWSADPLADRLALLDRIIFNCLIGNTDCHLKNASLLYNSSFSGIRLAPAYDLISTSAYESCTRQLSMHIGNARTLDEITDSSFAEAAQEVHFSEKMAIKRLSCMKEKFETALTETARELADEGYLCAAELRDHILHSSCWLKMS